MKVVAFLLFTAFFTASSSTARNGMSPVTRVVELLQGLSKKVEAEAKQEEDLYETFVCWAKTVVDSKTASNEAGQSRIDSLKQYIDDLENGRIELTSERSDLEKELETLNADIEAAEAMRKREHEDFLEAQDEMQKAIVALEKALSVLEEATKGHESGSLLTFRSELNEGFKARAAEAAALSNAVDLGKKFLTKGDALFLERLLTGDVPVADWKKLNRKAVFKMKYKARSFKIQDVLTKLLQTFQSNLADAEHKEEEAEAQFQKLMEAKHAQKEKAEEALSKLDVENGAKAMSKEDAQAEVDALTTQIENDKKYIEQTTKALEEKKEEWKDRKALRAGELSAISKAISILHSDDARDLFKKSFASQGYLFLQTSQRQSSSLASNAAALIRQLSKRTTDRRLMSLASMVAHAGAGGHFDKVIEAIDKMVATLKAQMDEDLETKEQCEKDRAEDTRSAGVASREIDEMSDAISKLEAEIEALVKQIEEMEAEIKKIEADLVEAERIRSDENTEWQASDKDDKAAAELVQQARDVLAEFYKENGLVFAQQPVVEAGKAPPPPPTTWEAPYGGKTDEKEGIVAILDMIKEDIVSDISKAKAEEDAAQAAYESFRKESEEQIANLTSEIEKLEGEKGEKEQSVKTTKEERTLKKGELDVIIKKLKDAAPGCDFISVNYAKRTGNHQIEIDGLMKAKAILSGAEFGEAPDPNREIKPGDALFLAQRH